MLLTILAAAFIDDTLLSAIVPFNLPECMGKCWSLLVYSVRMLASTGAVMPPPRMCASALTPAPEGPHGVQIKDVPCDEDDWTEPTTGTSASASRLAVSRLAETSLSNSALCYLMKLAW